MSNVPISLEILRRAIEIAGAGGTEEHPYDQESWCGTAVCVGGHARLLADQPLAPCAPEVENHPAASKIQALMSSPSPDVLRVMRAVRDDGIIDLSGADLQRIYLYSTDLRGANFAGADLRGAVLYSCTLYGTNFNEANLDGATLEGCYRSQDDPPIPGWIVIAGTLQRVPPRDWR